MAICYDSYWVNNIHAHTYITQDGEIVRPLADGSAPDPPEGFTIVVKVAYS